MFHGRVHDDANGTVNYSANGQVWSVGKRTTGSARNLFVVDEDGDYFYDGADGGAFDSEDDALLLRAQQIETARPDQVIKTAFDRFVTHNKAALVAAKLIGYCSPEEEAKGHRGLINGAQTQRLLVGNAVQQRAMFETMKEVVEEMIPGFANKLNGRLAAQKLPALPV